MIAKACHGPTPVGRLGVGPARPVKFSEDGPRPDPVHTFSNFRGPARPGPSFFLKSRPGPLQFSDRPGPAQTYGPSQAQ